ncbi:PTS transporter subunit EIIC [Lacrimispora sp.]|uniref:PTS transporter subunit EIIC n=1 Tax=Lacrimispora sp. TaxID=2719234 RepID=UPI0029E7C18E|nr:beta-glucoside system component [Lacrimispora sp.]
MEYKNVAEQILELMGGNENIESLAHCMTRLRFIPKDRSKVRIDELNKIPQVLGVMEKAGQVQVVMGNSVVKYYSELQRISTFTPTGELSDTKEKKKNIFAAVIETISGSMSPLIPAILGGGMIKVILILFPMLGILNSDSSTYAVLSLFGDAPFYFIPVMLAYTSAQKFRVTPSLVMVVAFIMLHPNFVNMVSTGTPVSVFGLPVTLANYSSSVIPILIMVWIMQYIERAVDFVVPDMLKSVLKPVIVILLSGTLALVAIGPLGTFAGQGLSDVVLWIQGKAGWLALALMAGFMPLIVITGMHWAFAPIFLIASLETPDYLILPAMLPSIIAQGAACMAVSLKSKNKTTKQVAFAASVSALIAGITEPALFGVELKYKKPMYAVMITGGICGFFGGLFHLRVFAFAVPSFLALPQFAGGGNNQNLIVAVIITAASFVMGFVLTWIFGFEEEEQ